MRVYLILLLASVSAAWATNCIEVDAGNSLVSGTYADLHRLDKKVVTVESTPGTVQKLHELVVDTTLRVPADATLEDYESLTVFTNFKTDVADVIVEVKVWNYEGERWDGLDTPIKLELEPVEYQFNMSRFADYLSEDTRHLIFRIQADKFATTGFHLEIDRVVLKPTAKEQLSQHEKAVNGVAGEDTLQDQQKRFFIYRSKNSPWLTARIRGIRRKWDEVFEPGRKEAWTHEERIARLRQEWNDMNKIRIHQPPKKVASSRSKSGSSTKKKSAAKKTPANKKKAAARKKKPAAKKKGNKK